MAMDSKRPSQVLPLRKRAATLEMEPPGVEESPMFGVAMLKIAMELKRAPSAPVEELITGVLRGMRLDESAFRAFLEANGGLLRTIAQRKRY